MELSEQDLNDLLSLEEGLWRADVRFDRTQMDAVFALDFFEFGRSGRVYDREAALSAPVQPLHAKLPLRDFHARLLDTNVAQLTYVSAVAFDGVEQIANRSSIWTRSEQGWQLRFHQGTAVLG